MTYNFDEIVPRENTNSVKYDIRGELFGKEDVIPLWVADMDFRTPDFIIKALKERLQHEILGYSIKPAGYYNAIISWLHRRHHWDIKKEWISFSPGVVPALNMAVMAYSRPGDKIILQSPVYHPFYAAIENNGRRMVNNPLQLENGRYYFDFDDLKKKIDPDVKMLFLCNPHNPVSRAFTEKELRELAEICIENNILIIADEIHSDLIFPGYRHIPIASLSEEIAAKTITCMAPSKTFNLAGMSTSFLVIRDRELRHHYNKVLEQVHIGSGNLFGTVALEAAYSDGDEWLDQLMTYLQKNAELVKNYLHENIPAIKLTEPEATYLMWLDCTELKMNNKELKNFMIHEAGLGLNDGPMFGPGGEGFQRMNIAAPAETIAKSLNQLKKAVEKRKSA